MNILLKRHRATSSRGAYWTISYRDVIEIHESEATMRASLLAIALGESA
jgi:hypothetical protein